MTRAQKIKHDEKIIKQIHEISLDYKDLLSKAMSLNTDTPNPEAYKIAVEIEKAFDEWGKRVDPLGYQLKNVDNINHLNSMNASIAQLCYMLKMMVKTGKEADYGKENLN